MRIVGLPLLKDNYAWLLVGEKTCAVVDPSEAEPVLAAVADAGVPLTQILLTHHHWDHVGGVEGLLAAHPDLEVICSDHDLDRIPGATRAVTDGEVVEAAGSQATCLRVPGHTLGAVAFHFAAEEAVFTGDTLFTAGCGRLFEGTPAQMHASLSALAALPRSTQVYCGHEYTVGNLAFAQSVDPDDEAVRLRLAEAQGRRHQGEPTVPATLAEELETNPFLRVGDPAFRAHTGRADPVEAFAELRSRKDGFRA